MNIIINNLPADVAEDEIRGILAEHGVPVVSVTLTAEGNPDRQTAVVKVDTDHAGATALAGMIHGKVWKERKLTARAMTFFTGED